MDTTEAGPATKPADTATVPCTLWEYTAYFLRLGAVGFGGPIALAGYMQKDLVEERRWITKEDYVQGVALAQLAPGPLAAQLAIYLGWVRGGVLGATWVGAAFILPSFIMVLALSAAYVRFGGIGWMQGAFYGVGAAVIAIIARSVVKLVKMTLAQDRLLWGIFIANGVLTAWTASEVVWAFALSGVVAMLAKTWNEKSPAVVLGVGPLPLWLATGLHGPASTGTLGKITWFFTEAGAFVFGSGLAIVPFLHGGVVDDFHWLTDRQFLDAVAVAMITPGPVVITVAFIGYLVAGPLGAVGASIGTFVPCYLFTVLPAPYFRRYSKNPRIKAFVSGVTAAATGAIAGAAYVLGRRALIDVPTILICAVTLTIVSKTKKIPEPLLIVAAGMVGLLVHSVVARAEVSGSPPHPVAIAASTSARAQSAASAAAPTFRRDVFPVLERECASAKECHGEDRTDSVELDLTPSAAYSELVGHASDVRGSAVRVKPGAPEESFILNKLSGNLREGEGKRMPLDPDTGAPADPNPVMESYVRDILVPWIRAGAKND